MQKVTNIEEIKNAINQYGEMIIAKSSDNVIIMNLEEYRNNIFDEETIKSLLKSEDDIENGRTQKASTIIKELREKYGF